MITYSIVGDSADNSSFVIVGNELQAAVPFDYETKKTYSITIRATDLGGLFCRQDAVGDCDER